MKNKRLKDYIVFWAMIILAVAGELCILFAAAYIAILIYNKSTFAINFLIALFLVVGVIFRIGSEVIKNRIFKK